MPNNTYRECYEHILMYVPPAPAPGPEVPSVYLLSATLALADKTVRKISAAFGELTDIMCGGEFDLTGGDILGVSAAPVAQDFARTMNLIEEVREGRILLERLTKDASALVEAIHGIVAVEIWLNTLRTLKKEGSNDFNVFRAEAIHTLHGVAPNDTVMIELEGPRGELQAPRSWFATRTEAEAFAESCGAPFTGWSQDTSKNSGYAVLHVSW